MMLKLLRYVGFLEGISFLFLLGVAMPMKYYFDQPYMVTYAGVAHGVLFLSFLGVLFAVSHQYRWSVTWFLAGLLASVLPFGTFVFDWKVKKLSSTDE